jgi:hypothetical protein
MQCKHNLKDYKPGSIGDRGGVTAMLSSQINPKETNGEAQRGIYLPELWSSFASMAGAVSHMRRMGNPVG